MPMRLHELPRGLGLLMLAAGAWAPAAPAAEGPPPPTRIPVLAWIGPPPNETTLDRFVREVPVQVLSFDHYPVVGDRLRPEWYENLERVAGAARAAGKPFWAFALSVAHGPYPVPTVAHLRLQVFSDLAYGAQAVQYFTYWTPGPDPTWNFNNAPVDRAGKRTAVYDRVKQVNEEVRALSGIFLGAAVVRVGHTGDAIPRGTQAFRPEAPVRSVKTEGAGAVVSLLEREKRRSLVVVNRDFLHPMPLAAEFEEGTVVEAVAKDGSRRAIEGKTYRAVVEPGDAAVLTWPTP